MTPANRRLRHLMNIHAGTRRVTPLVEAGRRGAAPGGSFRCGVVRGGGLNVASRSGLTQQREAPRAPPALLLPASNTSSPAGARAPRRAAPSSSRSPAPSRKCGLLLALSLRDKWLQRPPRIRLVIVLIDGTVIVCLRVGVLRWLSEQLSRGVKLSAGTQLAFSPRERVGKFGCLLV
ncbi:unnamed protein product [Pleuronectes platessa]|uniref:Uncharacterized protein n=1 Tax=Pleuronectes platessa TaxID=8262 RepID=A0A9N7V9X5_PLEPL|nr:unnamed protein product [Pleuronectes platessa]